MKGAKVSLFLSPESLEKLRRANADCSLEGTSPWLTATARSTGSVGTSNEVALCFDPELAATAQTSDTISNE